MSFSTALASMVRGAASWTAPKLCRCRRRAAETPGGKCGVCRRAKARSTRTAKRERMAPLHAAGLTKRGAYLCKGCGNDGHQERCCPGRGLVRRAS